jgi:dipeptidase
MSAEHKVLEEVDRLKVEIKRLGKLNEETGQYEVTFGVLVMDDVCSNVFEALVGTLRAAKKRGVVNYEGQLLLQGTHDKVIVKLLVPPTE